MENHQKQGLDKHENAKEAGVSKRTVDHMTPRVDSPNDAPKRSVIFSPYRIKNAEIPF